MSVEVRNVRGVREMKFALVNEDNVAVSLHRSASEATLARSAFYGKLEVVEIRDRIGYIQS